MYSVVLMVSLTTSPAIPDRHKGGRRGGRRGAVACQCYGGGYVGCYGGYGGCYGGCYGGGYGCNGGGSVGCYGGGYGCNGGGSVGCYGGGYGCYGPVASYGCCGPVVTQPPANGTSNNTGGGDQEEMKKGDEADKKGVRGPAPARLLVQLPANARLTVNGAATTSTSATRVFNTPPLQPGRVYHYDLTAETFRNGVPVRTTQRVQVRAGQQSLVVISFPGANTGTALARR
jgi:uncharacterized protein (TIGR03000 family)